MNIVFLGTPEFALPSLEKLLNSRHTILAVVTQPDRPQGRGNKLTASPVKQFAIKNGIKCLQYNKISREGVEELSALKPDIMITAAYGQILSQAIINIPKYGIINVHGSVLPKYRGASPVQTAVLNGDSETGVTIMQTDIGLDTGDIFAIQKTYIDENETAGELMNRLAVLGADLLLTTLDQIESGESVKEKQTITDDEITRKIKKEDCLINWNKSAKQIKCLVLASNPDPIAKTILNGQQINIYRARVTDLENDKFANPGTIIEPSSAKNGVFVQCGQGVLEILEAQFPGGKVLTGKQLFGGRKFGINMAFNPYTFPISVNKD